jgi:ubiquinone/menaquinone biosynthesis C-methylase UbiE
MVQDILTNGYDAVYGAMLKSPTLRRLWHEIAEGSDFPEEFGHISFVTLQQIQRMATELRLNPGDTFVDLGCGMAGPAFWMAKETKANLVGVDASQVGIEQATARAERLKLSDQVRFVVGNFAETGLDPASADGVMSEDAIQYARDKQAVMVEAARILRPGGTFVFTVFELDPERAAVAPVFGEDVVDDYRPLLESAGFKVEDYEEVSGWPEPMTAAYSAVVDARGTLTEEMGEAPVGALVMEMSMTLEAKQYKRRVFVVATRQ